MAEQLFSGSWYRVRDLKPRLRAHTKIHRHSYRGEIWYVLRDPANERFHRFTPAANYIIGIMDGERSVEEIWNMAAEELGDDAPTQDEMIRLLGQLHGADVLQCDVSPDAQELFQRWERHERQQLKSRFLSPFSIRIPLIDPERFLSATVDFVRPIFSWKGAAIWLLVVVPALVLAVVHWNELTENMLDRIFTPQNMIAVWLLFPLIKVLHELGHGYATKVFGGEVHDMGVMLLVFTPVPYVDSSSSWAFASKHKRALVGAGGMVAEIFIAALAFYVWLAAEPGAARAIAYNVLMIAGITTLLFNVNPLLRFDGYYILSDLSEIPNLRMRANKYWSYLSERYLFGNKRSERPHLAEGEEAWFILYPLASFVYRMFIIVAIFSWILDQFFFVGLLLGLFAAVGWVGMPTFKALRFLFSSPSIRRVRGRAWAVSGGIAAVVALLLFAIPMPLRSMSEGVVWLPEEAFVRPGSDGFIIDVALESGARVEPGDLLLRIHDPVVEAEERQLRARVRELEARHSAERSEDELAAAAVTLEELVYTKEELARLEERRADFAVRSKSAGVFVIARAEDLPGRFVRQGELLAHVIDLDRMIVRAVVEQDDRDLMRYRTEGVEVRMAERLDEVYAAEISRVVPAASEQLPSMALGSVGGGAVPIDPTDPYGSSMVSLFEVELVVEEGVPVVNAGGRVHVRFDHGSEALAAQMYRRVRQVFLSRFQV